MDQLIFASLSVPHPLKGITMNDCFSRIFVFSDVTHESAIRLVGGDQSKLLILYYYRCYGKESRCGKERGSLM